MQKDTIEITLENQTLKNTKNLMFFSTLAYIICSFVSAFSLLGAIGLLACVIMGLVGLYRFSKLAQTFVFKYCCFIFLAVFAYVLSSGFVLLLALDNPFHSLLFAIGGFVIVAIVCVYWAYCIAFEMSALTGRKEFITAFKLYMGGLVGILALIITNESTKALSIEQSGVSLYASYYVVFNSFAFMMLAVMLLAQILVALGIYRIEKIIVKNPQSSA
ncbi:MAG: hypothetical protein PUJ79_06225 [Helicobacter sp.]|nr:hypothetical protein [Helicobacter sp.]MDD7567982.1 hypothetical protein [Helicobacter sp.]MDY5740678.1 hypothetical protein [Helicobacter sp.]